MAKNNLPIVLLLFLLGYFSNNRPSTELNKPPAPVKLLKNVVIGFTSL